MFVRYGSVAGGMRLIDWVYFGVVCVMSDHVLVIVCVQLLTMRALIGVGYQQGHKW